MAFLLWVSVSCQQKEQADLIIHNARVYTVDGSFTIARALAVRGGVILDVGEDAAILGTYKAGHVVDAGGRPLFPGFIDGHCHFWGYSLGMKQYADLRGARSFDDVLQIIRNHHEATPYTWILGRGWDQNDWPVKDFPDNAELDLLYPGTPVILIRIDGHAVLANAEALRQAGITEATIVEGGQVILRDGKVTGMLIDNAAELVKAAIPEPPEILIPEALAAGQSDCFASGLTMVVDAGLPYSAIRKIDSLQAGGKLRIRINAMISPEEENFRNFLDKGPYRTGRLTVNSVKLYADGALGSRGALLLEPYADDPGNFGLLMSPVPYFREIIRRAYDRGFQVNTHCIGDSAVRMILGLYAGQLGGHNDRRWRIEHAQVVDPRDIHLFGQYDIIPSIQSTHCTSDMYWATERLGGDRAKNAYAYKKLLEQNGWLVNGTDFPIEEISPLLTFYAAVARKDLHGYPEGGYEMENALSREEALRSITNWAARGSFEEERLGSVEKGKEADLVILEEDIMTAGLEKIPGIRVWKTFLAGEEVYSAPAP